MTDTVEAGESRQRYGFCEPVGAPPSAHRLRFDADATPSGLLRKIVRAAAG